MNTKTWSNKNPLALAVWFLVAILLFGLFIPAARADDTKTVSYTVKYYVDGQYQASADETVSEEVALDAPDTLEVAAINPNKYIGYTLDSVLPTVGSVVDSSSEIVVNFVPDLTVTKTISYSVQYYLNGILFTTETVSETVWINAPDVLDVILIDPNKFPDYTFLYTDPDSLPGTTRKDTVFKAYYQGNTTTYSVEYYYNGFREDSLTLSGIAGYRVGETVNSVIIPEQPLANFDFVDIVCKPLTGDVASNVVEVIYESSTPPTRADRAQNTFSLSGGGLSQKPGAAFTITAAGHRQDEPAALRGDERYVPVSASANPTVLFAQTGGDYTATMALPAAGSYTLEIAYQLQRWNGYDWVDAAIHIEEATLIVVGDTPAPIPSDNNIAAPQTNANSAPQTNDNSLMALWLALGAFALLGICFFASARRKHDFR